MQKKTNFDEGGATTEGGTEKKDDKDKSESN